MGLIDLLMISFSCCFPFYFAGMANIIVLTRPAENLEGSPSVDQPKGGLSPQNLEEGLSDVEADILELMAPEKRKTLKFGPSLVLQSLINFYVSKGYFAEGECRSPGDEVTPVPESGEVVVFKDFFVAGMRFTLNPLLPRILLAYNVKLYHLMPNAIGQLSKFFWAMRTFGGQVSVDAFCRLFELHPQGQKITFEGEDELFEAQSGCCTFMPRCGNKKAGLRRIEISHA